MIGNNSLSHSSKDWIELLGKSCSALNHLGRQRKRPTSKPCGDGRSCHASAQYCKAACTGFPSRKLVTLEVHTGEKTSQHHYWGQVCVHLRNDGPLLWALFCSKPNVSASTLLWPCYQPTMRSAEGVMSAFLSAVEAMLHVSWYLGDHKIFDVVVSLKDFGVSLLQLQKLKKKLKNRIWYRYWYWVASTLKRISQTY